MWILSDVEVLMPQESDKTQVYTNVTKRSLKLVLVAQDIPMILNTTPSVYETQQGGGW